MLPTLVLAARAPKLPPTRTSYLPQAGSVRSPINAVASQDEFGNSDSLFQLDCPQKFLLLPPTPPTPLSLKPLRGPVRARVRGRRRHAGAPRSQPRALASPGRRARSSPRSRKDRLCVHGCVNIRDEGLERASQGQPSDAARVSGFIGSWQLWSAPAARPFAPGRNPAPFPDVSGNPGDAAPDRRPDSARGPSVNRFRVLAAAVRGGAGGRRRARRDTDTRRNRRCPLGLLTARPRAAAVRRAAATRSCPRHTRGCLRSRRAPRSRPPAGRGTPPGPTPIFCRPSSPLLFLPGMPL